MTQSAFSFPALARTTDPRSSHDAAERLVSSGALSRQESDVLAALVAHPGRTSKSLAEVSGLDRHMVARRLSGIEAKGRAERVERSGGCLWFARGQ